MPPSSASHLGERRPATSERLSPAETAAARPLLVHHDAVTARPVRGRFRASSSAPLSDRSALNTAVALPRFEVIAGACVHSGHPLAVPGGSGLVGDPHVSPAAGVRPAAWPVRASAGSSRIQSTHEPPVSAPESQPKPKALEWAIDSDDRLAMGGERWAMERSIGSRTVSVTTKRPSTLWRSCTRFAKAWQLKPILRKNRVIKRI